MDVHNTIKAIREPFFNIVLVKHMDKCIADTGEYIYQGT